MELKTKDPAKGKRSKSQQHTVPALEPAGAADRELLGQARLNAGTYPVGNTPEQSQEL